MALSIELILNGHIEQPLILKLKAIHGLTKSYR